ncbi:hypothetical protein MHY87_16375 [Microvirga sp. ACRRW]|uniref:hypothetical protein n=1 Tax=Microvirga sp. ACRRW TaxID=2918205 RepID=UPI001EF6781F|nr:hypothetical protein [Microvirga sp. ACRRW]MCG7394482.1 hypothetical protein [Microvirga sp. ACRRW]
MSSIYGEQRTSGAGLPKRSAIILIAVVLLAFLAHIAFMNMFFWQRFHSDSAVAYVVATQILDEGKLFPELFRFGNDLFFLRPQFAIAALLKLGMSGYDAYALATSLMFAVAFSIVAFTLLLCRPGSIAPLLAACLLFIPLGGNEFDYILAQQSHLMQCSLSLAAAVLVFQINKGLAGRLAVLSVFAFMMLLAIDSITRAILTTAAILAVSIVQFPLNRRAFMSAGIFVLALGAGFCIRHLILQHVQLTGVTHLAFSITASGVVQKLVELLYDLRTVAFSTRALSSYDLGAILFSIAHLLTMTAFAALTVWIAWKSLFLLLRRLKAFAVEDPIPADLPIFVGAIGLIVSLIGFSVGVIGKLDAVSRHALPGIFMIKFALVWIVANACLKKTPSLQRGISWVTAASLIMASPVILPIISGAFRQNEHDLRANLQDILSKLREIESIRVGSGNLYAEYWDAYRLAILTETNLSPAPVAMWEGKMVGDGWLSIPKRFCATAGQSTVYIVHNRNQDMASYASRIASPISVENPNVVSRSGYDLLTERATRIRSMQDLKVFQGNGHDLHGCLRS